MCLLHIFKDSCTTHLILVLKFLHRNDLVSKVSPLLFPSDPDFPRCPEDPPDAAAGGEGLHQLLILWDQADGLRGLRLPQREAFPVAGRHRIHLPDQQQCLPLGPLHTNINKVQRYPDRKAGRNRPRHTHAPPAS